MKSFVWIQYLYLNQKIIKTDIIKEEIYINYDLSMEKISFKSLESNIKIGNIYNITLIYLNKYQFKFNVVLNNDEKKLPKLDIKSDQDVFIYPDYIYFLDKLKSESVDRYLLNKIKGNCKMLFKSEIEIKEIELVDKKKYYEIIIASESEYSKEKIFSNSLTYDNIIYFFFFNKEFCDLKNIYGFVVKSSIATTVYNYDYYLKLPVDQ